MKHFVRLVNLKIDTLRTFVITLAPCFLLPRFKQIFEDSAAGCERTEIV